MNGGPTSAHTKELVRPVPGKEGDRPDFPDLLGHCQLCRSASYQQAIRECVHLNVTLVLPTLLPLSQGGRDQNRICRLGKSEFRNRRNVKAVTSEQSFEGKTWRTHADCPPVPQCSAEQLKKYGVSVHSISIILRSELRKNHDKNPQRLNLPLCTVEGESRDRLGTAMCMDKRMQGSAACMTAP